ncbi:PASTA domain-containing protein [Clavibacter sp. VKM Ac-2873]|uniref:PASTA domain-containing protein n=1 Tax=Clavibacter sp. VKM Ac-2873 TaxID=2783813 RepID=UPI00188A8347|nr:PASTA domain-containing protein [Clavibacter sp. VKM Ac-2873]MBF4619348.1 PASTA domain-containing protein [Clavibacter sp. VKM Ac-2873]
MPDVPSAAPAGWFPDGSGQLRYWDGSAWTQHVAPMVQPAAAQAPAPSTAATPAVAASQQADVVRNAQAAEAAHVKATRAAEAAQAKAVRAAAAQQQRAAKAAQRETAMQAKAAEREAAARDTSARAAAATVAVPVAPRKRASAAPVAPAAPTSVITDTRPSRHPATTWVIASVVALAVLIITALGGFGGMFVSLGLVALATGLYPLLTGRRSWIPALATRPRSSATAAGAILLLVMGAVVPVAAAGSGPRQAEAISATASPTPSATPTPTGSPTPVVHVVEDVNTKSATDARTLLREAGYVVQYVLESGEVPSVTDGMTVKSQSPAAGSRIDAGSTVTLTLLAPAPTPTPEPTVAPTVAPAPQPAAPAAPAPQPAAPAPVAPAPAAPAPAPASGRVITPGAFCKKTEVGSVEKSDTGKSYRCAPDGDGKRNRWYPM